MIARLRGSVAHKGPDEAVIDVGGVGYRVHLSLRSLAALPPEGAEARLRTRTLVRDDAIELVGFATEAEEQMFLLLTSVSHVGPKVALNILSGMAPEELATSIGSGDLARLTRLHGVGKKTAERLVVELKDKVAALAAGARAKPALVPAAGGARGDLISALVNLGYKPAQAERAADLAQERIGGEADLEALLREALRAAR